MMWAVLFEDGVKQFMCWEPRPGDILFNGKVVTKVVWVDDVLPVRNKVKSPPVWKKR